MEIEFLRSMVSQGKEAFKLETFGYIREVV